MVQRFQADPAAHPFPGSEDPAAALRQIAADYPAGRVLVVAHNTILRWPRASCPSCPCGGTGKCFPSYATLR
jgi:2,3-bisphosphoglycerate-dependent phosphoglycerate mutase